MALNFGGEEAYRSEWPALFFMAGSVLVIVRLVIALIKMFTYYEPLITQATLGINLEELGNYKIGEELDFNFAVAIVNKEGKPLHYNETVMKLEVY